MTPIRRALLTLPLPLRALNVLLSVARPCTGGVTHRRLRFLFLMPWALLQTADGPANGAIHQTENGEPCIRN
jgi:hypothetical protein